MLCDRYAFTAFARDVVRASRLTGSAGSIPSAALPDITFFFKAHLEVSLTRILDNRPVLKFHEAGMDLKLSPIPTKASRLFQGRIFEQYLAMSTEFNFTMIDVPAHREEQQGGPRDHLRAGGFKNYVTPKTI